MAAGLATPQDVRLNEPGPICQDSKKRRPFADEYACLGMHSLRVRFRKRTRRGADSGTKTEVSRRECVGTGEPSGWAFLRTGASCRKRFINPQQPPEEGLHPWDTSVFVPEFLACGVLYSKSIRFLASFTRLSSSGDSHSRALTLGALRAHARCSIFESEDTARICPKSKSAGGFPADC